jgi:hypothetical protein
MKNAKDIVTVPVPIVRLDSVDPILEELWEVKRIINLEANFDLKVIAKAANRQSLASILERGKVAT